MEGFTLGFSTPRDILTITKPQVMESINSASSSDIALVYALSYTQWTDDDIKVEVDKDTLNKIEQYLESSPKTNFSVAWELAINTADLTTTWGGFKPKISPELNQNVIDWLTTGILKGDNEEFENDIKTVADFVSGRIASGDSFLTSKDLKKLINILEPKVLENLAKNTIQEESWTKIKNDLEVARVLGT